MSGTVKLNSAGGGSISLTPASTASNVTATVPAATDTLVNLASSQSLSNKTITAANTNTVEATSGPTSTQLAGQRNKIINGAMMIDQRNAGAAVTYNGIEGVYNLDRFQAGAIGGGAFTVQQSSTAPAGFCNSQKYTVTVADTSLAASDRYSMYQYIEGYNVCDLSFGTSGAKSVIVSFWVQSSLTGTYGVWLSNGSYNRSNPSTITINAANTWEYKTVAFSGDTTGTWATNSSIGLILGVTFAMGSSYQGTANTWAATAYFTTSGQTNWMATVGNTFYITGVQLEKGATATPFENRLYGTELALCQRYLPAFNSSSASASCVSTGYWNSTTQATYTVYYSVTPRTPPTGISVAGTFFCNNPGVGNPAATTSAFFSATNISANITVNVSSGGGSAGVGSILYSTASTSQILFTGCEL